MKQFERENQDVIDGLKALADVSIDRSWRLQTRGQLLALAQSESLTHTRSPYILSKFVAVPTLSVLMLIAVVGSSAAFAAQSADPSDFLYPLKLATEKIQQSIATTPKTKLELQQKFVQRRFDELDILQQEVALGGRNIDDVQGAIRRNKQAADDLLLKIQNATLVQFEKAASETVKQEAPAVLTQHESEYGDGSISESTTTTPEIAQLQQSKKAIIFDRIDAQIKQHREILVGVAALTLELEERQKAIIERVLEISTTTSTDVINTYKSIATSTLPLESQTATTTETTSAPISSMATSTTPIEIQIETKTQNTAETMAE